MSRQRDAILGRFRSTGIDRLRRMSHAANELAGGRGGPEEVRTLARDLHTLKGEARMLGQDSLAVLLHAAEERLDGKSGGPSPAAAQRLVVALDLSAKFLGGELGDEKDASATLRSACDELLGADASADRPVAAAQAAGPQVDVPSPVVPSLSAPSKAAGEPTVADPARWVQVSADRVDAMSEKLSDFALDFRALQLQITAVVKDSGSRDERSRRALTEELDRTTSRLDDLSKAAWQLRLVPVAPLLFELAAHARTLAAQQGKLVKVAVQAGSCEVERSVLEELPQPLLHLVRNAVDHGLERPDERHGKSPEGSLLLSSESVGPNVVFSVQDDGRGVDLEKVRSTAVERGLLSAAAAQELSPREAVDLLFMHGFSTRTTVSEVSGRGVGLDIVRSKVESVGGSVTLRTPKNGGTRAEAAVPSSISRERALVVDLGIGPVFAVPARQVVRVVRIADYRVESTSSGVTLRLEDGLVPLRSLARVLGLALTTQGSEERYALLLQSGEHVWALSVPTIAGEHDLLRRPVDALFGIFPYVAASSSLDTGRLVLLLSVADLSRSTEDRVLSSTARPIRRKKVLVVDDSPIILDLLSEILSAAGFEVEVAKDGRGALAAIEAAVPDLVLSDIDMPVMTGFELLPKIRAINKHLPVVMLSTHASADDRRQAAALGANAYLIKSDLKEGSLTDMLERFLAKS